MSPEAANPSMAIPASRDDFDAGGKPFFAAEPEKMAECHLLSKKEQGAGSEFFWRSDEPFFSRAHHDAAVLEASQRTCENDTSSRERPSRQWSSQEPFSESHSESQSLKENWEFLRAAWNQKPQQQHSQQRRSWQQHFHAGVHSPPQHPPRHPPQQPVPRTTSLPDGHQRRSWQHSTVHSPSLSPSERAPPQEPPTVPRTPSLPRRAVWQQQCHVAQPAPQQQSGNNPHRRPSQPRAQLKEERKACKVAETVIFGEIKASTEEVAEKSPTTITNGDFMAASTFEARPGQEEARRISALLHASNQGVMVQQRMAISAAAAVSRRAGYAATTDAAPPAAAGAMAQLQVQAATGAAAMELEETEENISTMIRRIRYAKGAQTAATCTATIAAAASPTAAASGAETTRVEENAAFRSWVEETLAFRSPHVAMSGEWNHELGYSNMDIGRPRGRPAGAADNAYTHKRPWRVQSEDVIESVSCNPSPRYIVTCPGDILSSPPSSAPLFGCSAFATFDNLYTPFSQKSQMTTAAAIPVISNSNPHKHIRLCHNVPSSVPHSLPGPADLAQPELSASGAMIWAPASTQNTAPVLGTFGLPVPGARVALVGPPTGFFSNNGNWQISGASPVGMQLGVERGCAATSSGLPPLRTILKDASEEVVEEQLKCDEGAAVSRGMDDESEENNEGEKGDECGEVCDGETNDTPVQNDSCKNNEDILDLTLSLGGGLYVEPGV
ncbi:unnamed protein product [Closterium sp. NIES-54]